MVRAEDHVQGEPVGDEAAEKPEERHDDGLVEDRPGEHLDEADQVAEIDPGVGHEPNSDLEILRTTAFRIALSRVRVVTTRSFISSTCSRLFLASFNMRSRYFGASPMTRL